jgi:hypothetical protein
MRDAERSDFVFRLYIKKGRVVFFLSMMCIIFVSHAVLCDELLLEVGFLEGYAGYGYCVSSQDTTERFLENIGIRGLSFGMGYNFYGKYGGIFSVETNEISITTHESGVLDAVTTISLYSYLTYNVHAKRGYGSPYYYAFFGSTIGTVGIGDRFLRSGVGMQWTFRFLSPGIELSYRRGIEDGYSYFSCGIHCELGGLYAITLR